MILSLTFVEICFSEQNMFYFGECSYALMKNMYFLFQGGISEKSIMAVFFLFLLI